MKIENKIILLSFGLGVAIWVADSFMDYFLFYEGTFTELLITEVPSHEVYIRVVIRDDQGYWKQIETYIHENSEAKFSHGICPDCAKELYPEFINVQSEKEKPV